MMRRDFEILPEMPETIKRAVPLGRMAEVDEVADVIVFLCSPSASYMHGAGKVCSFLTGVGMLTEATLRGDCRRRCLAHDAFMSSGGRPHVP